MSLQWVLWVWTLRIRIKKYHSKPQACFIVTKAKKSLSYLHDILTSGQLLSCSAVQRWQCGYMVRWDVLIILVSHKQYRKADTSSGACTYVLLFGLDHKKRHICGWYDNVFVYCFWAKVNALSWNIYLFQDNGIYPDEYVEFLGLFHEHEQGILNLPRSL